jgi:hypothetical protein
MNGLNKLECYITQGWNGLLGTNFLGYWSFCNLWRKWSIMNMMPEVAFATVHFLRNLWMGPISKSVTYTRLERPARYKFSRLLGFLSVTKAMKCYEYDTRGFIHNSSFSWQIISEPNKLECCITQGVNGLSGTNFLGCWAICKFWRSVVNKGPIQNSSFSLWLTNEPSKLECCIREA